MSGELQLWNRVATPVQHDMNDLAFVSRGVEILAAGDINYVTSLGYEDTLTVTEAMVPYFLKCYVKQIKATATTIADADMRIGT